MANEIRHYIQYKIKKKEKKKYSQVGSSTSFKGPSG